jgi:uncharacterized 2Fe-2S/4Fe-4S cluster protein (DUF4445 family)
VNATGTFTVLFGPRNRRVSVPAGTTVRQAAALAGIAIEAPCGGQGNCGKCKVRIVTGSPPHFTDAERALLSHDEMLDGCRLACQLQVRSPMTVEAIEAPVLSHLPILVESRTEGVAAPDPPVRVFEVALDRPTLEDDVSDFARLERVVGPLRADLDMLRTLSPRLRENGYRGAAIISHGTLLDFSDSAAGVRCCAAAFDVGTTTLAASLIDLVTGAELASASRLNPQTVFGDDVLSRISFAAAHSQGLVQMHQKLVEAVNEMIGELASAAAVAPRDIYEVTFAGNTTMQHLLLKLDPTAIGSSPFTPVVSGPVECSAKELGLAVHSRARCYVFPVIAGYVGGDAVAGLVSTRFEETRGPALFLDIGTNGEMAVLANGRIVAASCAAGPAFEGACIVHGMRAAAGAIEAVRLEDGVALKVIGGGKPIGLCGSALIDLLAELLRLGIVDRTGAMRSADSLPDSVHPEVRSRLQVIDDAAAFVVVEPNESANNRPIVFYQRDVRQLQLAIAAVRTGLTILLRRLDIKTKQLEAILVAGAFGNYIRCRQAQRIGLLPAEVDADRIAFVGNTSLAGARMAALSLRERARAQVVALRTEHVELSLDSDFESVFVDALLFPESTDYSND